MAGYLSYPYHYGRSFFGSYRKTAPPKTPEKMEDSPAEITLKEKQLVYQDLFSRLEAMNSCLYRKDYKAFMERWTHLKNYEGVWTPEMGNHLDPLIDGQFFNIWFNPDCTFPIGVLKSKLEGCIDVTRKLACITEAQKKQMYSDLYSHLIQLECYVNFGDFQTFRKYASLLEAYQSVWTPEMQACFDPMEDFADKLKGLDDAGLKALKENLSSCMQIVQASSQ